MARTVVDRLLTTKSPAPSKRASTEENGNERCSASFCGKQGYPVHDADYVRYWGWQRPQVRAHLLSTYYVDSSGGRGRSESFASPHTVSGDASPAVAAMMPPPSLLDGCHGGSFDVGVLTTPMARVSISEVYNTPHGRRTTLVPSARIRNRNPLPMGVHAGTPNILAPDLSARSFISRRARDKAVMSIRHCCLSAAPEPALLTRLLALPSPSSLAFLVRRGGG